MNETHAVLMGRTFHILEAQMNNRILPHELGTMRVGGDCKILKKVGVVSSEFCVLSSGLAGGQSVEVQGFRRRGTDVFRGEKGIAGMGRQGGLQEVADHAHVQGFPEAPGAGDKVHLAGVVDKVRDKMGFIDEVAIVVDEFFEISDTLSQFLFHDAFSIACFGCFIYALRSGRWA